MENTIKLLNIQVFGKFNDGVVRQILVTELEQLNITKLLVKMSKTGNIQVLETPINGVDWDSEINLGGR